MAISIDDVASILRAALSLDPGTELTAGTALFGSIPEFDSMAVVAVLTALEDQFGIVFDDDDVSAEVFESVGSLHRMVASKAS